MSVSAKMTTNVICVIFIFISLSFIQEIVCEPTVLYMGCYKDGGHSNRLFKDHHKDFHEDLTPDKCKDYCLEHGFAYSGIEYSYECFCSNKKPPEDKKSLESECNSNCSGDKTITCGGPNRMAVFTTGAPETQGGSEAVLKHLGCFKDSGENRLLSGHRRDFPGSLTNQKCVNHCTKNGFRYAGTEYGKECYCGNTKPSFKDYASDEECVKRCDGDNNQLCGGGWRLNIYEISNSVGQQPIEDGKYVGCYKDQENPRALGGHTESSNTLTPLKCAGLCYSKGFLYSGTQFSYQCFCGDKPPNPISKVNDDECNKPCSGDPLQKCGGEYRNSIRETGIQDLPVVDKYLGCFNDEGNQIFKQPKLYFDKTNTPRRCMNFCSQLGFRYSGVEYGKECFCGNKEPSHELVVNPEDCNMACTGDPDENCGSGWRLAVYATSLISPVTPVIHSTPKTCITSETLVSGRDTVCRHDVIFEEKFNSPLGDRWSHVVMVPDAAQGYPEHEYAVFTSDPKNSFTSKNKLVIQPTVFNDTFVLSGSLRLKGCTGTAGSRQCGYDAKSYNILPPVASARIHTSNSFSFRYGIVEIRAKLPLGDWLVPELWLEPRSNRYGPAYASGRIRIAMSRGNADIKCHGEDLGSNLLESGVVMGSTSNVLRRSLTTKLPANWHDHFHNYTLIWTPEKISFKIDNEQVQELIPTGRRLCEVVGFEYNECLTWSSGSRIAPFDQDFYISLGLTVGNARDFPDECTYRGKSKPWRNLEQKAMLNFWKDKVNWQPTWTEENSSLYIDHIRVTAL